MPTSAALLAATNVARDWSGSVSGQGCCDLKMSNTCGRLQVELWRSRLSEFDGAYQAPGLPQTPSLQKEARERLLKRLAGTSFSRACCTLSCSARFRSCKKARIFAAYAACRPQTPKLDNQGTQTCATVGEAALHQIWRDIPHLQQTSNMHRPPPTKQH